eukprot:2937420-Rhodomonas_salina.1
MHGTKQPYHPTQMLCIVLYSRRGMVVRYHPTQFGTEVGYGGTLSSYALFGTEVGYGGTGG